MAYFKIYHKNDGHYLRIVKSKRKDGKVIKETVYNLGKVEDYSPEQLKRFGLKLYELGGGDVRELLDGSIEEVKRLNYGYYQLYQKVFRYYQLDSLLDRFALKHKLQFSLTHAVLLMVLERLNDPCSKRQNAIHAQEYFGIRQVELHHLYRALDYLADYQHIIQQHIFSSGRDLFNQSLDVVFYDVTTFYFESEIENENALRQKGFSKDGKIGKTQVLFALLIDKEKNPIGFEVYPGNTFEGHTFEGAVKRLKNKYHIKDVVIVADRGMLSKANLDVIATHQYQFIVGDKLKMLPALLQKYFLDRKNYTKEWTLPCDQQHIVRYASMEYKGRLIIATYSDKRAQKDKHEREEKVRRAAQLLKHPSQLNKKAHHYFLKKEGTDKYILNQERIEKSQQYNGLLAISTNARQLNAETILDHYAHLFQIEHSFRTFKSYMETRPMFHWTDKRILGHLTLCFISYALLNHALQRLRKLQVSVSENQLRDLMDKMQVSLVKSGQGNFYLRSQLTDETKNIINKLGLKPLPNLLPEAEIQNYFN